MRKTNLLFQLILSVAFLLLLSPAGLGQNNAQLEGVVTDATGAVIPGVEVTLSDNATNLSTTVISNETGRYIFVNIRPGSYMLAAELPGFKRASNPNVILQISETATLNITLETGEITEEVTVTSETAPVDSVSQSIRVVVDEKKIADLPLVGRNPMNLFFLQAGANRVSNFRVDFNGLRNTTSNVQIEGISALDNMLTGGAADGIAPVIVEAMAEYSVTTSSAAAEAGLGGGAQVQMIYKSGTNQFHGSVFEFHRNKALNANSFYRNRQGQDKPAFRRHQYGFAVGGPIVKDKAFFHFTYEKETETNDTNTNREVWTDRFKQNQIFQYTDTQDGLVKEIDLKTADPSRTGVASEFSAFAALLPSPNNNDVGDGFNTAGHRYSSNDPQDQWRLVAKGDYVISDKHRMGISYADRRNFNPGAFHILGHRNRTSNQKYPAGIFTLTSNFTPTFLNELRMGGTKRDWKSSNGDASRFNPVPLLNFNSLGGPSRGGNANRSTFLPQAGPSATLTINNNTTWIQGDHTFKGGIDVRINRSNVGFGGDAYIPIADTQNSRNPATIPALAGLSSSDEGRAAQLLNDITGTLGTLEQSFQQINADATAFVPFETKLRKWRSREYSFFFQDTWKFNDRLTVQLGTRYEVLPPHFEANDIFSYPVDSSGNGCVQCLFGISGPGETSLGLLPNAGRSDLYPIDWNNFAPNLGFTWDLTGNGKTTLASNYRIAYDRNPLVNTLFQDFSQEGASTALLVFGAGLPNATLGNAAAISAAIDPGAPFGPKPFNRNGTVTVWDRSYSTPYVQSWSLRLQRELMRNTVLEISYVGNHAVGEPRAIDINQLNLRSNGFLAGFLVAQDNLALNGDPLVGRDTGVFGQIWSTISSTSGQNSNISRGETAAVANFIDRTLGGSPLAAAGLPDNFFRANPQFDRAELLGQNSHSTFHGVRFDVRRRFTEGLQFQANYAFGKGLSDYTGGQSQRDSYRDNENPGLDKSRTVSDAKHIINTNFIYELPFGRGQRWANFSNGFLDGILGGWQVNGIFTFSSGQPVTIQSNGRNNLTNRDSSTVGFAGDDPTIASSVNTSGLATPNAFTAAEKALFTHPLAGSAGFTAQRYFPDGSFSVLDASLFKNFRTPWFAGEDSELQFRFEFFNATNSTSFNGFNTNLVSSSFGNVTRARDARIVQVALKFIF